MKSKSFFALAFTILIVGFFILDTHTAFGQFSYTPLEKIPGASTAKTLPQYIEGIYKFGIWTVGIAALFMLTIGGFVYMTSGGNTSTLSRAKGYITDALIGLVLALVAYLILNVINPDLVNLNLSKFSEVGGVLPPPPALGAPAAPSATYTGPVVAGCIDCQAVSGVPIKPVGSGCKSPGPCQLNKTFLSRLKNVTTSPLVSKPWWITEAWPPIVKHSSKCHYNGTCADINFTGGVTDPASVQTLYQALRSNGFNVVYETFSSCSPYTKVGVPCKQFKTTTGSHFHVY